MLKFSQSKSWHITVTGHCQYMNNVRGIINARMALVMQTLLMK